MKSGVCLSVLSSPVHHRARAAINPWSNDNSKADRSVEEILKPDVRGLRPELPYSLRLYCFVPNHRGQEIKTGEEGRCGDPLCSVVSLSSSICKLNGNDRS